MYICEVISDQLSRNSCVQDFSDSVNRPVQSGFKVQPSEFGGVSCERDSETVMERYLRLKEEVGALVSDVQQIQDTQESAEKLLQVSPADLLKDVRRLMDQQARNVVSCHLHVHNSSCHCDVNHFFELKPPGY